MSMNDDFKFTMPAEIVKAEDGSWKIGGLASTESLDRQNEKIIQKGLDLTPVDQGRGFFNFDHSNAPEDLVGTIDGYKRDSKGLYVHGKLFKGHKRAEAIYAIMQGLDKSKSGAVGLSVEGRIIERDLKDPKIIKKCQIKNVAITFNPVNTDTYAGLMKSMVAGNASIDFDATGKQDVISGDIQIANEPTFTTSQVMTLLSKALTIGAGQNQAPADRSGGDALVTSDMKSNKKEAKKKKLKKMNKDLYKSSVINTLDKICMLYPEYSRNDLWEALKERLTTTYPEIKDFDNK